MWKFGFYVNGYDRNDMFIFLPMLQVGHFFGLGYGQIQFQWLYFWAGMNWWKA